MSNDEIMKKLLTNKITKLRNELRAKQQNQIKHLLTEINELKKLQISVNDLPSMYMSSSASTLFLNTERK